MTTENKKTEAEQVSPIMVHTQYIKSLSHVSPGAPLSLAPGISPKISVNINMDGKEFKDLEGVPGQPYEIVLSVEASAKTEEGEELFALNLSYGLFITIAESIPKKNHHPLLMIEGPKLAFPFVRQIVAEVTQNSGFPPLMLTPVSFEKLYRDQYLNQQNQEVAGNA